MDWYSIDLAFFRPICLALGLACSWWLARILPTRAGRTQFYLVLGISLIDVVIQLTDWGILEKTDDERTKLCYLWNIMALIDSIVFLFCLREISRRFKGNDVSQSLPPSDDGPDTTNTTQTN